MERKLKRLQPARNGIQYITSQETREELSPFVFFDAGSMTRDDDGLNIGMHPHSGIGIITHFEGVDLKHDDTGDNAGIIKDGGVQWMHAGGGIFHAENYVKSAKHSTEHWDMSLYQLWLQLPPELEEAAVAYKNLQPEEITTVDNVKIIVGSYKGLTSSLKPPYDMTYLSVELKEGEKFEIDTPTGQTTGFVFPTKGDLQLFEEAIPLQHLSVLESNEGIMKFKANTASKFVFIMAAPQKHPILTYSGSIHTNEESMIRSLERIQKI